MWLYLPSALTPVSFRDRVPSTLPSVESFETLARSSTWRTKSRTSSDWQRVWSKERSIRRLCGPTLTRFQAENSEAVRTWLSEDFPVKTSASPVSEPASEVSGLACSSPSSEPFATWDAAISSWRTLQPSLWDATSTQFLGRWPTSVLMLSGAVYERPTLARLMAGIAGGASHGTDGLWPTPVANDDNKSPEAHMAMKRRMPGGPRSTITSLQVAVKAWPTPHGFGGKDHTGKLGAGGEFEKYVNNWPTPQEADGERQSEKQMRGNPTLLGAARQWPTPSVADTLGGHISRGGDRSTELLLPGMAQKLAENWATPSARDWRSGDASPETLAKNSRPLNEQATAYLSGPQAQPIAGRGKPFSLGGRTLRPQLSALFVEWLMGLPLGWSCVCVTEATALEDSATQLSRPAQKRRSGSSGTKPSAVGRSEVG